MKWKETETKVCKETIVSGDKHMKNSIKAPEALQKISEERKIVTHKKDTEFIDHDRDNLQTHKRKKFKTHDQ